MNFDHFDTQITPEEIFSVLTPEEIDELAREDLAKQAYNAGFFGECGEGDFPDALTLEEQDIWTRAYREGRADERDEAETQEAIYREQAFLYGED